MARIYSRLVINSKLFSPLTSFSRRGSSSQVIVKSDIHAGTEDVFKLSTLFVPGRHGANMYQITKPLMDIDYIANNLENLKFSCNHRGISINFEGLLILAEKWSHMRKEYLAVVERDQEAITALHRSNPLGHIDILQDVNSKRNEIQEKIMAEKEKLHCIEDELMPLFQKIPHVLHPNTPLLDNKIDMSQEPPILNVEVRSHADIAKCLSMLHFTDNSSISYFMTGKLSELDFAIQMYFADKLESSGFMPLSCVDFCKSFIIEATGHDPYSNIDCIQIQESRDIGQKLNLIGGASFETFCAYLTNMNANVLKLPTKYFSLGRRYNAANKESNVQDLFSVVQSNNVHCLILSESSSYDGFDVLLHSILKCYSGFNIPFRIVSIAAKNLTVAESRRKQLELWSPALKDYVPVAYVSQHDDFVSKRLQITCGIEYIKDTYCHIVEGAIVNVPVLIGCIIENFQTKNCDFNIPSVLKEYLFLEE